MLKLIKSKSGARKMTKKCLSETTSKDLPVSPKSSLSKEQLWEVFQAACRELKEATEGAERCQKKLTTPDDGGNPNSGEVLDRANLLTSKKINAVQTERYGKYASKLYEAIEKILDGKFDDHCKKCGKPIPLERLLTEPQTNLCVPCKERKT